MFHTIVSIKNDGHYFCRAGGNRPDGLNEPVTLKAFTLGATMVLSFSLGLALTLVTVGVGAAISVQQAAKRWSGFSTLARRAPYFSSILIGLVGVYMGIHGYTGIMQ